MNPSFSHALPPQLVTRFVDGALDPVERVLVELWLAEHPADQRRVEDYQLWREFCQASNAGKIVPVDFSSSAFPDVMVGETAGIPELMPTTDPEKTWMIAGEVMEVPLRAKISRFHGDIFWFELSSLTNEPSIRQFRCKIGEKHFIATLQGNEQPSFAVRLTDFHCPEHGPIDIEMDQFED